MKEKRWRMLFGVENEYNTNCLSYKESELQYAVPYEIIRAAHEFGGLPNGSELSPEYFYSKNIAELIRRHEKKVDKIRYKGFTGWRLPNRMRVYVDMSHPEISTAECTNPRDLLLQQKASELMIEKMRTRATSVLSLKRDPIVVCKNNSSGFRDKNWTWGWPKGWHQGGHYETWATHENYLVPPDFFEELTEDEGISPRTALWLAFLVSRIYGGSGKVGSELDGHRADYQIFQRADFIEKIRHLDTISGRALINTRDNPYANPAKYRRLHVICGDALIAPWSIYLTYGATALFLKMLIEEFPLEPVEIKDPVRAFHLVSRDITGKKRVIELAGEKGKISALELQQKFLADMERYIDESGDEIFAPVVQKLKFILNLFETNPERLKFYLDWAIKRELLKILREDMKLNRRDLKLEALDYHDMNPDKEGCYFDIEKNGFPDGPIAGVGSTEGIVTREEIERAVKEPPEDSRAYFGGEIVKRFPGEIVSLSWNALEYRRAGQVDGFFEYDPWFSSKNEIESLLDGSGSLEELIAKIGGV